VKQEQQQQLEMLRETHTKKCYVKVAIIFYKSQKPNKKNTYLMYVKKKNKWKWVWENFKKREMQKPKFFLGHK